MNTCITRNPMRAELRTEPVEAAKCLHFDGVDAFACEWDESVTADDGRRRVIEG